MSGASMMWMRIPGQSWPGAAASFLGMWVLTMMPMMLPSALPMLWRYWRSVASAGAARAVRLTALAWLGYIVVWALFGIAVFPLGALVAATVMAHPSLTRATPLFVALAVCIAGAYQLTAMKAHHLACCGRAALGGERVADAGAAWRHGLKEGIHCIRCCANLTLIVLVIGIMNAPAMVVAALVIAAERLAPAGVRVARGTGVATAAAGLVLMARAAGLV